MTPFEYFFVTTVRSSLDGEALDFGRASSTAVQIARADGHLPANGQWETHGDIRALFFMVNRADLIMYFY
jgi:hypothetical protein